MQLRKRLSTPPKISAFAKITGISEDYLIILKREIGSLEQKPVPIAGFPGIDQKGVSLLDSQGIINSKEYFEGGFSNSDELSCLCDLVRINGVGSVVAKAFYEAGYRSVKEVAVADAAAMLEKVSKVNDTKGYYRAKRGERDMKVYIDFASLLVKVLQLKENGICICLKME